MKKIIFSDVEMETIRTHKETCESVAKAAMERSGINFDDIESINEHYESHNWGSNSDRLYRNKAVKKAIAKVAANPLLYV